MNIIVLSIFALTASAAAPAATGDAAAGKAVFSGKCVTCHGKDAKGNPTIAKMYKLDPAKLNLLGDEVRKMTAAEQVKIVTDGKGDKMKPFKEKLTEAEIANVVAYLRSLPVETAAK